MYYFVRYWNTVLLENAGDEVGKWKGHDDFHPVMWWYQKPSLAFELYVEKRREGGRKKRALYCMLYRVLYCVLYRMLYCAVPCVLCVLCAVLYAVPCAVLCAVPCVLCVCCRRILIQVFPLLLPQVPLVG